MEGRSIPLDAPLGIPRPLSVYAPARTTAVRSDPEMEQ
jgi:hypothetical protein